MASTAASLKTQFDFQTRLFNNVLEGLSNDETNTRHSEQINHIKWIAGHITNTRLDILNRLTGGVPDTSYGAQFGRGSVLDMHATYPAIEEIIAKWNGTSTAISEGLNNLPEEILDSKAPAPTPVPDDTVRGMLSFLIAHEGHHIGQLSILRKMAGKPAMSFR
jgi:uncharacterized damage-inducible protein DinB